MMMIIIITISYHFTLQVTKSLWALLPNSCLLPKSRKSLWKLHYKKVVYLSTKKMVSAVFCSISGNSTILRSTISRLHCKFFEKWKTYLIWTLVTVRMRLHGCFKMRIWHHSVSPSSLNAYFGFINENTSL